MYFDGASVARYNLCNPVQADILTPSRDASVNTLQMGNRAATLAAHTDDTHLVSCRAGAC
jgi:hypothetical protein